MPRIRTIKPDFWTDETITECSLSARLLFIGTWNFADDNGNIEASAKQLKMKIFPDDNIKIASLLGELISHGLLTEYSLNGCKYLHIKGFKKHQVINRPSKTNIPKYDDSLITHGGLTEDSRTEGKGREGKGKEGKEIYGEFVYLTSNEYLKLTAKFGEPDAKARIEKLNNYLGSTGKRYKSHYHTILNWASKDNGAGNETPKKEKLCLCGKKAAMTVDNQPTCRDCIGRA